MENLDFFKQQAKNFLKDYKTRVFNENEGFYEYNPRFFNDIDDIIYDFDVDEEKPFTLMNAQHLIARLAGFYKWNELIKASEAMLEIGKYLLLNRESGILDEWKYYEKNNLSGFDDESKLEIFKKVFIENEESNKTTSRKMTLDFTNDTNAQDMIYSITKEKNITPEKAIVSSITQKNFIRIIETGYVSVALPLWGHDNPYREKAILDNPKITFKLSESKERLISIVMDREEVSFEEAILFFILIELENLGYHI